jgi:pyruvate dehydrogenase (quinone)/pyruvate oxidase
MPTPVTSTRSEMDVGGHTAPYYQPPLRVPLGSELERAAALFEAKRKIVILADSGARGAIDELLQVAERLSAPVVKPLLG